MNSGGGDRRDRPAESNGERASASTGRDAGIGPGDSPVAAGGAPEGPFSGKLLRNPFVWAFFAGIVLLTLIRPMLRHEPEPPDILGTVPQFELTDQTGATFTDDDMRGRTWVASFIFTSCRSICPLMVYSLKRFDTVAQEYAYDDVKIVSFTVDPEFDTPDVLAEFGEANGIDPERWRLVTGPRDDLEQLAEKGFLTAMGERETLENGMIDIAHAGRLALVDPRGRIRGWYSPDDEGLEELMQRTRQVRRGR